MLLNFIFVFFSIFVSVQSSSQSTHVSVYLVTSAIFCSFSAISLADIFFGPLSEPVVFQPIFVCVFIFVCCYMKYVNSYITMHADTHHFHCAMKLHNQMDCRKNEKWNRTHEIHVWHCERSNTIITACLCNRHSKTIYQAEKCVHE